MRLTQPPLHGCSVGEGGCMCMPAAGRCLEGKHNQSTWGSCLVTSLELFLTWTAQLTLTDDRCASVPTTPGSCHSCLQRQSGTNPELKLRTFAEGYPTASSQPLGADGSLKDSSWGHLPQQVRFQSRCTRTGHDEDGAVQCMADPNKLRDYFAASWPRCGIGG